jgi:hypothetical protein
VIEVEFQTRLHRYEIIQDLLSSPFRFTSDRVLILFVSENWINFQFICVDVKVDHNNFIFMPPHSIVARHINFLLLYSLFWKIFVIKLRI